MKLSFYAQFRPEWDDWAILVGTKDAEGHLQQRAKPLEFVPHERGHGYSDPTMALYPESAQALMNALWDAGVRPRNVGTAGELGATQRHLADMRSIVFAKLAIPETNE